MNKTDLLFTYQKNTQIISIINPNFVFVDNYDSDLH